MSEKAFLRIFFLLICLMSAGAFADTPVYTSEHNNKALRGYDSVSYFTGDGHPVKGSENFQTSWRGADWYFSSQKNLELFKSDPEEYAPQYGGYCAWATAHGGLAKGDPNVYHLQDGKIYLNYDMEIKEGWLPERAKLIPVADKKFPGLIK